MFASLRCRKTLYFGYNYWTWIVLIMPKYAVAVGHKPGIYDTWPDCSAQVKGCKGAKFKKFNTEEEAQAFIDEHRYGRKRRIDDVDGPDEAMDYESRIPYMHFMAENLHPPDLMRIDKLSPSDGVIFTLNSRLTAMESKVNNFIDKTTKILENLTARVVKMEGLSQSSSSAGSEPAKKVKMEEDTCEVAAESFIRNDAGFVTVYTDGACSSNGKQGAKAGIGVWFAHNHPLNVSAPVKGPPTNNTAEIQAARVAISQAASAGVKKLQVHTDSQFVINCITKWIHRWKKNGWKLTNGGNVKNKTELIKLENAIQSVDAVEWIHVRGHSGTYGNEMADSLARNGAAKYNPNVRYADHVDGLEKDGTESPDLDHLEEDSNSSV